MCNECIREESGPVGTRRALYPNDPFFIAEPEISLMLNVVRFLRIGISASYRYIYGIDTPGISDKDFSQFAGSFICAFGWF